MKCKKKQKKFSYGEIPRCNIVVLLKEILDMLEHNWANNFLS